MANIRTLTDARKLARELHAKQEQERAERDRLRTEDVAVLLMARTRLADVDAWSAEQIAKIGVDADRRRSEHTRTASEAVQRMRARGDTVKTIAGGSGMTESQVRKLAAGGGGAAGTRRRQAAPGAELGDGGRGAGDQTSVPGESESRPPQPESDPSI